MESPPREELHYTGADVAAAEEQMRAVCGSRPEVTERVSVLLGQAHRLVAPATLVRQLDAGQPA